MSKAVTELRKYGIHQTIATRFRTLPSLFLIVFGCVVAWLLRDSTTGSNWAQILLAFVAGAGIVFGYQQWRAVRQEISLDKYYDRLELVNRRLDASPAARTLMRRLWNVASNATFELDMYVY